MNLISKSDIQVLCQRKNTREFAPAPGSQFEAGALALLASLPILQFVHVHGCILTESDLVGLAHLRHLKRLSLSKSTLKDDWLRHLTSFAKLSDLWLENTGLTDAGLEHVGNMPFLDGFLELSGTRITDRGLPHLARLVGLRHLGLRNTPVTDAGVLALGGIPKVSLYTDGSQITPAGLDAFIRAQREHKRSRPGTPTAPAPTSPSAHVAPQPAREAGAQPASAGRDDPDITAARGVLFGFIKAMNAWESKCTQQDVHPSRGDTLTPAEFKRYENRKKEWLAELQRIFEIYCTPKKRAQGRPNVLHWGGDYLDPEGLVITEIARPKKDRLEFFTREWNHGRWLFVLLKRSGQWKLDGRQIWIGGWTPHGL